MKARKQVSRGFFGVLLSATLPAAAQVGPELSQHWNYDQNLQLDVRQLGVQERHQVKLVDLTYTSPVGDREKAVGPNGGKIAAYLVLPPGKGPFPAVIYGHWCMPGSEKKNRTEFLEEALVLAQSGVISLLPDHVSVRPEFVEDPTPFSENQVAVTVQQVVNLRRGADLLLAQADVDAKRMAYVGHSCDATAGGFFERSRQAVQGVRFDGGRSVGRSGQEIEELRAIQAEGRRRANGCFYERSRMARCRQVCVEERTGNPVLAVRERRALSGRADGEGILRNRERAEEMQNLQGAARIKSGGYAGPHRLFGGAVVVCLSRAIGGQPDSRSGAAALAEGVKAGSWARARWVPTEAPVIR